MFIEYIVFAEWELITENQRINTGVMGRFQLEDVLPFITHIAKALQHIVISFARRNFMKTEFVVKIRARKIVFLGALVFFMLLMTAGTAFASPTITGTPASGGSNSDGFITIKYVGTYSSGGWSYSYANIDPNSIVLKVDGTTVTPTVTKGATASDGYTATYTISPRTIGSHTIYTSCKDDYGSGSNFTEANWSFSIVSYPTTFSSLNPADNTLAIESSRSATYYYPISVAVYNPDGIMSASQTMSVRLLPLGTAQTLTNQTLTYTANTNGTQAAIYGELTEPGGSHSLAAGTYEVTVTVKDKTGVLAAKVWDVLVTQDNGADTGLTNFSALSPDDGAIMPQTPVSSRQTGPNSYYYHLYYPISMAASDPDGILNSPPKMTVKWPDGTAETLSNPTLTYVANTNEKQATLYGELNLGDSSPVGGSTVKYLQEGTYAVTAAVKDKLGNTYSKDYKFKVLAGYPTASAASPAAGSTVTSDLRPTISCALQDNGSGINPSSIVMTMDNLVVPVTLSTSVGFGGGTVWTVRYYPTDPLLNGVHTVTVNYSDNAGFAGTPLNWSFNMAYVPPMDTGTTTLVSTTPAENGLTSTGSISATVYDPDGITAGSDHMVITFPGGSTVIVPGSCSFVNAIPYDYSSPLNAAFSWNFTPPTEIGTYSATVTVKDKLGNQSSPMTWQFKVRKDYPVYALAGKPDYWTHLTFNDNQTPTFNLSVTDSSGVDPATIVPTIDGNVVSCTTVPIVNGFVVSFAPSNPLSYGTHTIGFTAADNVGYSNPTPFQDTFYITATPVASNMTPAPGRTVNSDTPAISVHYSAPDGLGITTMTVDGLTVSPKINLSADKTSEDVTCQTTLPAGQHTASVIAHNSIGAFHEETWTFTTAGYTDMDLSDGPMGNGDGICLSCHGGRTQPNSPKMSWTFQGAQELDFDNIHTVRGSMENPYTCFKCHGLLKTPQTGQICVACHQAYTYYDSNGNKQWAAGPFLNITSPHSTMVNYAFSDHNNAAKYLKTAPSGINDCIYCHEQTNTFVPKFGKTTGSVRHDLLNGHKVSFPDDTCQGCHSDVLTREHAAAGRTDAKGNAMTCASCHLNDAVKANIPNYQPYRYRVGPASYNGDIYWPGEEEYSIPGKKITAAKLTATSEQPITFTVQGYWDGAWHDVYTADVKGGPSGTAHPPQINGYNNGTGRTYVTNTADIIFSPPAEKVKIIHTYTGYSISYVEAEAKLDNWVVTPQDSITCATCHVSASHQSFHSTDTVLETSCQACHKTNLVTDHQEKNASIICDTCHKSSRQEVKDAVANGNKNCTACHASSDHETVHSDTLDSNCQTCHTATLTTEHLNNEKTTGGKNYTCDTCHSNTSKQVKRSIASGDISCAGCHTTSQTHNIQLADQVPADIPLDSGFLWSAPMEASLYTGEPTTPTGYDNGQMILSKRRANVTAAQVWSWVYGQFTAKSWVLNSPAPAENPGSFSVEFKKGSRFVTVKSYNSPTSADTVPTSLGNRTELWYK